MIDQVEDQVGIHAEVLVDDDVTKACDRSPRNIGHTVARLARQGEGTASPITARLRRTAS